jgi:hypothetical protein|tara:strand:+ start:102 stop:1301 length:1200 start_codon:yes stop_codon:yes gene_type:complete
MKVSLINSSPKSKDKFPSKGNGKGKYKASIVPESQGMTISKDNRDGTFILIKDIVLKTKDGKYVPGDHPTAIHQNVSRSKGYNPDKVRKFEDIIKRGEFKHGDDVPPVVVKLRNGKYRLVSGHHRFEAHYNVGCAYMFVIIVEFNDCENFNAEYWLYTWQDIENKEDKNKVDKEVRTEDDIISNILHCCRQGLVDVTNEEEIKTVLVHRGISRKSSKFLPMLRTIQRESGKYKGIPRVYTDADKHLEDHGLESDVNVLTPVMMESKSGKDSDRDPRWIRRVLNLSKVIDKVKPIISYFHWDGLLTKEIIKVREVKDSQIMIQEVDKALDLLSFIKDGGLRRIDLRYLPQIEGDDEDYVSADPETWEKQIQEIEGKIKAWEKKHLLRKRYPKKKITAIAA